MSKNVALDLDSILKQLGPFRKFNRITYTLLLIPIFLAGHYAAAFIFEAPDINYRCRIPECEPQNDTSWLQHALPLEKDKLSKCKRYRFKNNISPTCSANDFDKNVIDSCSSFVYEEDSAVRDRDGPSNESTEPKKKRKESEQHMNGPVAESSHEITIEMALSQNDGNNIEPSNIKSAQCNITSIASGTSDLAQTSSEETKYTEKNDGNNIEPSNITSAQWHISGIASGTSDLGKTSSEEPKYSEKNFNLGCQDWKRTLIGSIHNLGLFISLPLTGIVSDKYGRKLALSITAVLNGTFGFLRSFSMNYIMLLVLEFLETSLGAGMYTTAFVLAMEMVTPKGRVLVNTLISTVFVLGVMNIGAIAWFLQRWRALLRVIYIPAFFILSYLWILCESVRWLLTKGRNNEAAVILKKAAKMNKVDLSEEALAPLFELERNANTESENIAAQSVKPKSSTFMMVIKSSIIRKRVIVCSFLWITCTFVYYGLSINSVFLAGNKYVNFMLVAFAEIPANLACLVVLDRIGRKLTLFINFILSACFCIGLSFVPTDHKYLALIVYLFGKFCITMAYSTVYIYVSEVFPTNVRQSLMAVCSAMGRVGSTLAPLTPLLAGYYASLPSIFFGCLALIASLLIYTLPETINVPLPDTIEEAERLSKNKS